MDDAPAPDSPKNILNVLDDDCIGEILRRLIVAKDFLNVAKTCKRFQKCAMDANYRFKEIGIVDQCLFYKNDVSICPPKKLPKYIVPSNCAPMYLQNFGHLIKSIDLLVYGENPKHNNEIYELIVQFCGEILKSLWIVGYNPSVSKRNPLIMKIKQVFKSIVPIGLGIKLMWEQKPWYIRCFPHLVEVKFQLDDQLTDGIFTEFVSLNPHLQALTLNGCDHISPNILKSIGTYCKNLRSLKIRWSETCEINDNDVMHMKTLQKLEELTMFNGQFSFELLMNMFVDNNIPICSLRISIAATETAHNLPNIETLKKLTISPLDFYDDYDGISDDCIINLIKNYTALEHIEIYDGEATMQAIVTILELGKNLTKIEFWPKFRIDFTTYNKILNLAKNRVKVNFLVDEIDVPMNVIDVNREWLDISLLDDAPDDH